MPNDMLIDNYYEELMTKFNDKKIDKEVTLITLYNNEKANSNDCVLISSVGYFLKDDPNITIDIISGSLIYIKGKKEGIIGYNNFNRVYVSLDNKGRLDKFGYTINNNRFNGYLKYKKYLLDPELLRNPLFFNNYKEDLNKECFVKKNDIIKPFIKNNKVIGKEYHSGNINDFILSNPIITNYKTFGKKYSFGIEIETSSGYIPRYIMENLYTDCVFDGSLRHKDDNKAYGMEYTTTIYKGDQGLKQLKKLCNEISKRCIVNELCSVHIHLGDVIFSKENIVYMYYLYQKIEEEILSMLPLSRRDNEFCRKIKFEDEINIKIEDISSNNKNYLYEVERYYNLIIYNLSKSRCNSNINKKKNHPMGYKCHYDHSTMRYCWVNFIPAVFNTRETPINIKSNTIEFRPMMGSSSYKKIKNWLLICFALVDIVENHKNFILSKEEITLEDIITMCYNKNSSSIINYINSRKELFNNKNGIDHNYKIEQIDYSDNEIDEDLSLKAL